MQPDPYLHIRFHEADIERRLNRRALERAARAAQPSPARRHPFPLMIAGSVRAVVRRIRPASIAVVAAEQPSTARASSGVLPPRTGQVGPAGPSSSTGCA